MLILGVVSYLLAQSSVTAIIGDHIQPIPAPEDLSQYPLVTYQSPSDVPEYANDGPIGVTMTRVVFDCIAPRYLVARTLALAIKDAFSGYSGLLPDGTHVFLAEIANLVDTWQDGNRLSCTSVHVLFQTNA